MNLTRSQRKLSVVGISLFLLTLSQGVAARRVSPVGIRASDLWSAPRVDARRLLAEDAARSRLGGALRVGIPMKVALTPATSGIWEDLPGGGRVWRLRVRSEGALWIVLNFGTFRLEAGGRLHVRDPGRRTVLGPFTAADVRPDGQLWLPPIAGDTAVVELEWPEQLRGVEPNIHLGQIGHGYRPWGEPSPEPDPAPEPIQTLGENSGFCNVDVNCPLGAAWQQQKLGVVELLITTDLGILGCSGSLVNNTELDCWPYILTARHCFFPPGSAPPDPASTTVRFNHERSGCNTGTAPTNQTLTGASIKASRLDSDVALIELTVGPQGIPSNYGHYFNGWNRSATPPAESWCIHHPTLDPRKINYNGDVLTTGQTFGFTHWRVTEWEIGTTEFGSSGAPLFDSQHRIVGQLHGGTAACDQNLWDEFGKLSHSWAGEAEPSPAARLKDSLDPRNTGLVVLDGLDPSYCAIPRPRLVRRTSAVSDGHGSILDPGDGFTVNVELHNNGTLPATGITGTLTTTTPGVTVVDGETTWPDLPPLGTSFPSAPFRLGLSPEFVCGNPVNLQLSVPDLAAASGPIVLETGRLEHIPMLEDDIEGGINGWTVQVVTGTGFNDNPWVQSEARSNTPTHSWLAPNIELKSDTRLVVPALQILPSRSILQFTHYMNSERTFDGGVLEYSLNNGSTWTDARPLITQGGYNTSSMSGLFGSPLAGRPAWSGDLGSFQDVEVDLSSLAGSTISLRWRFATDSSAGDEGWYVDDVRLEELQAVCRRGTPGARCGSGGPGGRSYACGEGRPRPPTP